MKNLILPGNPRYQPKSLTDFFGYDNLYRFVGRVEIANLEVLGEIGRMPKKIFELLSEDIKARILEIETTQVDITERNITKHDIRAWIAEASKIIPEMLAPWLHIVLTSYDPIDTARALQFYEAHWKVVEPKLKRIILILAEMVIKHKDTLQIGRTHGQHALPITAGFWLATILDRLYNNYKRMNQRAENLVGKISGAVGAYNAQVALGITEICQARSFEERILDKLGLKKSDISTQIAQPEPLADYLFSALLTSATFAQFGRDCRHLMRSEVGEISEEFSDKQSGSSTMAHKRNPINFENLEGMFIKNKHEFGKIKDSLISEHQRDLTGSSVARDFPIIIINLVQQMETLLRPNKEEKTFLERISINETACRKNFDMNKNVILSEPLYIALQMAGYHDAHHLVNHTLVPKAQASGQSLFEVTEEVAQNDLNVRIIWDIVPDTIKQLMIHPENYTGLASYKAMEIANKVEAALTV